jgi:flavin-dependent dehydrogenase
LADGFVRSRWIIGADGSHSLVRRWAGLDGNGKSSRRFCLRQHFQIAPWAEEVVLYWCGDAQIFVTPVAKDEVGVAIISHAPLQNMDDLIAQCPALATKLRDAEPTDTLRGEVTVMRRLPRVYRKRIALIGDASGSVDAITGQGLCLAFLQAQALGRALRAGDLRGYQRAHAQIMRKPRGMARLLLLMARHRGVRSRAMHALSSEPALFSRLLGLHVGETAPAEAVSAGLQFGWRFLTA